MASFVSVSQNVAESLKTSHLLYVHCVSTDDYSIKLTDLLCLDFICREIHVSFLAKLNERRIALVPKQNGQFDVNNLFQNANSPSLLSVKSSCDIKFLDLEDSRVNIFDGTLIWDYEVVPSAIPTAITPVATQPTMTVIDRRLPLLNHDFPTSCNCFNKEKRKCLVSFDTYREEKTTDIQELLNNMHLEEDEDAMEAVEEEEDQENREDEVSEEENDNEELFVECFKIVGSHWEQRYQDALSKCYQLKVTNALVQVRAEAEPDNIRDSNAIKFEVYCDGHWHIMGYCAVRKIPKLKKALHGNSLISLEIFNLKRNWFPQAREFMFIAGVNIVKRGQWEKDDFNNRYNSVIPL